MVEVVLSFEALFETVCVNELFGSGCFVLIALFVQGRHVIEKLVPVRACLAQFLRRLFAEAASALRSFLYQIVPHCHPNRKPNQLHSDSEYHLHEARSLP